MGEEEDVGFVDDDGDDAAEGFAHVLRDQAARHRRRSRRYQALAEAVAEDVTLLGDDDSDEDL